MKWYQKWPRMFSTYIFLFALLVLGSVVLYDLPEYEELEQKEITVQQLVCETSKGMGKASQTHRTFYLATMDGERMELRCILSDFHILEQNVPKETVVTVKYFEKADLRYQQNKKIIMELTCDGMVLLPYDADLRLEDTVLLIFGLALAILGVIVYRTERNFYKPHPKIAKDGGKKRRKKK